MRPSYSIALALMLAATPAFACSGQSVYLDGKFKLGDQGWGTEDARFKVSGTEAVLTPEPGTQNARWDTVASMADTDVCATFTAPSKLTDASRTYAGLLFWLTDKDNFYQAIIAPNGLVMVARKVQGKITTTPPVGWTKAEAMKLGPDAKNTLRVTLEGPNVVVRLNDAEVARFKGQAPQGQSHVGLVAASSPDAASVWRVADVKATNLPGAPTTAAEEKPADKSADKAADQAADKAAKAEAKADAKADPKIDTKSDAKADKATKTDAKSDDKAAGGPTDEMATGAVPPPAGCADSKAIFEDRFTKHDQAWGPQDDRLTISGGEAAFKPSPGTGMFRWNRAFMFSDVDVCANVRLAKNTPDPTASYAGLLFWVADNKNYYQAVIAPNGYFTVARVVDGKVEAKRPVGWTQLEAVKKGAKEKNTMRIAAKGDQVKVFINGKEAASFKGEAPKGPSYIGMFAASGPAKPGDTWEISDLRVSATP